MKGSARETEKRLEEKVKGAREQIKNLEVELSAARSLKENSESRIRSAVGKIDSLLRLPEGQSFHALV